MSFNDNLKILRNKLGLSQEDISNMLNMSQSQWSHCERGFRNLSVKRCYTLIKIAKLKDIDINIEYLRPN